MGASYGQQFLRASRYLACLLFYTAGARADVGLRWREPLAEVFIGDALDVELLAVSDQSPGETLAGIGAIVEWDSEKLRLAGIDGSTAGYEWFFSSFPPDHGLDGLNADCSGQAFCSPYTGLPFNDGTAYYEALSNFPPALPATATTSGLVVTRMRFVAISSGMASISLVHEFGEFTKSRVLHGEIPGREITGPLGPPISTNVSGCRPPVVEAAGSRYLQLISVTSELPVAILVEGDSSSQEIGCVSLFVQSDGSLDTSPEYQPASAWTNVLITDREIIPSAAYLVSIVCGDSDPAEFSEAAAVMTWPWGDVDESGEVTAEDVVFVLDASSGVFHPGITLAGVDLSGCIPNRQIDAEDIVSVLDAIAGIPFTCPSVCADGYSLKDFSNLHSCFNGPFLEKGVNCDASDIDGDGDVDLHDFGNFQTMFRFDPP